MSEKATPSESAPAPSEGVAVPRARSGLVRLRRTARTTWTWSRRLLWLGVWFVVALTATTTLFLTSSREVKLAGHDAVLRPVIGEWAQLRSGPLLPDLRLPSGAPIGVNIDLGKTSASGTDELVQRYALLAAHPDAQVHKIRGQLIEMAASAALRGAALGLVPIAVWGLVGARRRRELLRVLPSRRGLAGAVGLSLIAVSLWQPWVRPEPAAIDAGKWISLDSFLGDAVTLPSTLDEVEIFQDATTSASKRLVESVIDTYEKSKTFYENATLEAAGLELRQPEEGETVALLVTDRHDNVGMDPVARAIGEAGGATAVLDAGDDTSTGDDWEAFSLDSLADTFADWDRWVAVGNHDNGAFVGDYLADRGWSAMDGSVTTGPGGVSMLGAADPRSSGWGTWRDEGEITFEDVRRELADTACDADGGRVELMLVHDANLGKEALARGCVGLVVGGHMHVQNGPNRVVGANGSTGFTFTNGTTGGAAFGIAVGSKLKREAQVSLITFKDGRAVGIQPISVRTDGKFVVADWTALGDSVPLL